VARLGGDAFAIIQTGLRHPDDAATLARHVMGVLGDSYEIGGQQVISSVSIGVALAPNHGTTPDDLVKNADIALYRAKADGRDMFRLFDRTMDEAVRKKEELKAGLRTALERGELELHFQPLVELTKREVTCFEALLRWRDPVCGLVLPADFVPVAEETGLIVPIGEWALRTACREAAKWPHSVRVAVNCSPVQFRNPGLLQLVTSALQEAGLAAERLELEITESVLLHDDESNLAILRQLRALGVRIALDDFGTGFSSLGYLLRFPFDKLKIDRSFVMGLPDREESSAIVRAILGMCRNLGISTAAEGVETEGQLDVLRQNGCREAQGYLFSRPVVATAVAQIIARRRRRRYSST
jgi:predicted signal transduction protein with EAL and GGDEF domain